MRLTLTAAAVSIALSAPAMAADIGNAHLANGSELLTFCAKSSGHTQSACMGYIVGVSDALISDLIRDTKTPRKACIPRSAKGGDRAAVVVKWMSRHSDQLRQPAATLVVRALAEAYPCRKR